MDHLKLGGLDIHRIHEIIDPDCPKDFLFPTLAQETLDRHVGWLAPDYYDARRQRFLISIHSWLVRTDRHTILIDTCGGNHKPRAHFPIFHQLNTPYLENLKAAGCRPEDIDYVFCTHLHIDHVGWNTRLQDGRWVPTFPNAKYLFGRKEYEITNPATNAGLPPERATVFEDSVLPVVQAGQSQLVDDGFAIDGQFTVEASPGHTLGHCLMRARSQGRTALFTGDALHHPLQIAEPDVCSRSCADPTLEARSRRRIFDDCAEHGHLLVPAHFCGPHVGHVRRRGEAFEFLPGL